MRSRNFAVFFSLLVLSPSACSAPALLEPTSTQEIAVNTTSAATPEPSATPEPTQTPTAAPLQLEVVDSYQFQAFADSHGFAGYPYIAARVRNPFDFAVDINGLATVLLLDSTGETALRTEGATTFEGSFRGLEQIMPGETIGILFCACYFGRTVEWDTWKLDFNLKDITPIEVSTDFEVNPGEFAFDYLGGGNQTINGTLRYTGNQPLRGIWVRFFLYDEAGKFVAAGGLAILGQRIPGGFANINPGDTFDLIQIIVVDESLSDQNLRVEATPIGIIAEQ